MNRFTYTHFLYCAALLLSISTQQTAAIATPKTFFLPRTQAHLAQTNAGTERLTHIFDTKHWYGYVAMTPSYGQSYKSDIFTNYFFGSLLQDNKLQVAGSKVPDRSSKALLADYFGLPTDFKSSLSFSPRIQTAMITFDGYMGLNKIAEGLYLRWSLPACYTSYNLNVCETDINPGVNGFDAGYTSTFAIARSALPADMRSALNGTVTFGDMQTPLKYGKLPSCSLTSWRAADLTGVVGWDFAHCDNYHLGAEAFMVFPLGTRPTNEYIFEPIIGNGHHLELGAGITSHVVLWQCHEDNYLSGHFDMRISHLFGSEQQRSFDFLQNGPWSRYILAAQFQPIPRTPAGSTTSSDGNLEIAGLNDTYARKLVPGINVSTLCASINIPYQLDAVLKLCYTSDCMTIDGGYNLWSRAQEKIEILQPLAANTYALKGDAFIYGTANGTIIPLSASQNTKATATTGGNATTGTDILLNPGVDMIETAVARVDGALVQVLPQSGGTTAINTSLPIFLQTANPANCDDISSFDVDSARAPHVLTHTFFGAVTFMYEKGSCATCFVPWISLGASVSFDGKSSSCSETEKDEQLRSAVHEWNIWMKLGLSF